MFQTTKELKWDMAHRLPTHWGKCFNVHGHTYKALITIEGQHLQEEWVEAWMLKDFWNFKPLKEWIDENRDHAYVWSKEDEVLTYLKDKWFRTYAMDNNPTAENMTYLLYQKAKELLGDVNINKIIIYETPTSYATYTDQWELPF